MVHFEQLGPGEGARLRSIRLRALQDAPDAFGTTFEQASANSDDVWAKQVVDLPTFVGVKGGRDVAMVRCTRDRDKADTAWLLSMWVAPEIRRSGVGASLVDLVVAWARANGISRLLLDVADLNAPAVALYAAKGFVPNGETRSMLPPRQHIREHQRELHFSRTDRLQTIKDVASPDFSLRPAIAEDMSFLIDCFLRSMQDVITACRGEWNPNRESEQFQRQLAIGTTEIIERSGLQLGFLTLSHEDGAVVIHTVCVLPEHQTQGIGTSLVQRLFIRHGKKPFELSVLKVNTRAKALWERLGFRTIAESEHHFRLKRGATHE